MADPRYDVAIYSPSATHMYLGDTPAVGGAERQMVMLARSLASLGLRVCHVVRHAEGLPQGRDGVDVISEGPVVDRKLPGAMITRAMRALACADARVYVQRTAGLSTLLVGAFARSRRRTFIHSTSSPQGLEGTLGLPAIDSIAFKLGLACTDAIVVQTQSQARAARRRRKVVHIPSFCEPASPAESERDIFLWVGRAAPYKNPLAFVALARELPDARFVMVGIDNSDPHRNGTGDLLEASSDLSNLQILPPLIDSDLFPLYERAVAVVNTSDFEGFSNSLMEGWARGALALSLRVDPDGVIQKHGIGAVAGGSRAALAAAARQLWTTRGRPHPSRYEAARYVAEHHSPTAVAARWSQLISDLLQARPSAGRGLH